MKYIRLILLPLLIGVVSFSVLAQGNQTWVTVYTDNFSGYKYELGPGRYDNLYLAQSGLSFIGSIKVPAGMKVTIYSEDNFRGHALTLKEDAHMRYLEANGFADIGLTISMIVAAMPAGSPPIDPPFITLYQDNFSGASKNLAVGHYEAHDFGSLDNDQISSIKIPKGLIVTIYEHAQYGGKSLVLKDDVSTTFLIQQKFNNSISSLRVDKEEPVTIVPTVIAPTVVAPVVVEKPTVVVIENEPTEGILIYQGNYSGVSQRLGLGRYVAKDLNIGDNELSSIKVPRGYRVTLFDQPDYKGKSLTISEEDARTDYMQAYAFDNLTSSLLVEDVPRVILFSEDFDGFSNAREPGLYNLNDMGIENDDLSSIKIPAGMWVLLFEHSSYEGRSLLLMQDAHTNDLARYQFNDIASSMMIGTSNQSLPEITIYQDDFHGVSKKLTPGFYEVEALGIGNNTLSSVSIPRGLKVTLYEYGGQEGRQMIITKSVDTDFLKTHQFNDITTSMLVEIIDPRDQVITIYSERFAGFSQALTPGRYRARDITIGEHTLTSIKIPKGMQAKLYQQDDCKGPMVMVDRDTDFSDFRQFDNYYSSIEVEDVFEPIVTPVPSQPIVVPPADAVVPVVEVQVEEPPCTFTEKEYYTALKAVEARTFSQEKMEMARMVTKDRCLTNEQIRSIAKTFDWEDQSLEFIMYAYDLAVDKSTYYTLEDVFKFMSTKDKFMKFLSDK